MIVYSLLKTNSIFTFISEYITSNSGTLVAHVSDTLFSPWMMGTIIAILILTLVILGLMSFKKKPIGFYIYNIITYGFVTIVYVYSFYTIRTLEVGLVDIRVLKSIRDLTMLSLILQAVSLLMVSIRATGFNIKKFDFGQDLVDLQIAEEDNEEFEVDVELDTDHVKRRIRKTLRHAKYVYIENKFLINILTLLGIGLICFIVYLNVGVYHKVYRQNEAFTTNEFMMNITNSYITNVDYHGDSFLEDQKLVVVEYQARNIYAMNKKIMKPERFSLVINHQRYRQTEQYQSEIYDLGNFYKKEYMSTNFQTYIMTYLIPKTVSSEQMILQYQDVNKKTIEIAVTPNDDTKRTVAGTFPLNQSFEMNDSIMKGTIVKLEKYEIADQFIENYHYCITETECLDGVEYISPSPTDNYEKSLLKLTGYVDMNEKVHFTTKIDLYTLIRDYGTIYYTINGESKKMHFKFKQVKPTKAKQDNVYYIEVRKELKNAEKITFSFMIRDQIYEIVVK